jgi:hypothetical protein
MGNLSEILDSNYREILNGDFFFLKIQIFFFFRKFKRILDSNLYSQIFFEIFQSPKNETFLSPKI